MVLNLVGNNHHSHLPFSYTVIQNTWPSVKQRERKGKGSFRFKISEESLIQPCQFRLIVAKYLPGRSDQLHILFNPVPRVGGSGSFLEMLWLTDSCGSEFSRKVDG